MQGRGKGREGEKGRGKGVLSPNVHHRRMPLEPKMMLE